MPFFDPLPEPLIEHPELEESVWSPPAWDRPSEGTVPAVLGVGQLFGRTENVALALDHLRVYPNGFQIVTTTIASPRLPAALRMGGFSSMTLTAVGVAADGKAPPRVLTPRPGLANGPRIGVLFANGQRAGARADWGLDIAKDDAGIPTEPFMRMGGGGGGGGHYRWEHWVFPVPPSGPLTVFAEWSMAGIAEASVVVSGDEVRDASHRAIVLWS